MICPECGSKLSVKDTREIGFSQIRHRICRECDFQFISEEKMQEFKKRDIQEISYLKKESNTAKID